jgi:transposase-like protein
MLQVALEQEVEDFLGRAHYKRGERKHQGWRNGYEGGKVTTAEGFLEVAQPRVRETEEPFHSRLSPLFRQGSHMLGRLVREM